VYTVFDVLAAIDEAWADGGCQHQNGNRTTPHVAWDGALFCATPPSVLQMSYWGYWTYNVGCRSNIGSNFGAYLTVLQSPYNSYVKVRCIQIPALLKVDDQFQLTDTGTSLDNGYDWWYASIANFPITTLNKNGNKVQKQLSEWTDPHNQLYSTVSTVCGDRYLEVETDDYFFKPKHGKPVSILRVRCSKFAPNTVV